LPVSQYRAHGEVTTGSYAIVASVHHAPWPGSVQCEAADWHLFWPTRGRIAVRRLGSSDSRPGAWRRGADRGRAGGGRRIAIVVEAMGADMYGYAGWSSRSSAMERCSRACRDLTTSADSQVDCRLGNERPPNTPNTRSFYMTGPRHNTALTSRLCPISPRHTLRRLTPSQLRKRFVCVH
jgi:hypothetical protein